MESQLKTKQKTKQKSSESSGALNYITCVCLIPKLRCHFCTVLVIITCIHQERCLLQKYQWILNGKLLISRCYQWKATSPLFPLDLFPFSFPPSLRRDKTTCNFVLQPVDSINNKMLARKGSYVHKHQTICLLCNGVTTLGKITVTQPTPLSLEVFASCFNEVHLTVLILMHNGIKNVPQSLARHNRLGRCRILPTRL